MVQLIYVHQSRLVEGFYKSAVHDPYSSAIDDAGGQGKVEDCAALLTDVLQA